MIDWISDVCSSDLSTLMKVGSFAHDIDYPLGAKVCSRDIQHKTDSGGVITNIRDFSELVERSEQILRNVKTHRPDVRVDGILVQAQEERLLELILGFRRDPLVGPIIMLGAGGIMARSEGRRVGKEGLSTGR